MCVLLEHLDLIVSAMKHDVQIRASPGLYDTATGEVTGVYFWITICTGDGSGLICDITGCKRSIPEDDGSVIIKVLQFSHQTIKSLVKISREENDGGNAASIRIREFFGLDLVELVPPVSI
jgi:hypothetical protein